MQEKIKDDTISRQAAIDVLNVGAELLRRVLDDADVVGAERAKYKWGLELIESYISDIKDLPSAESERKMGKWIHGIEIAREYLGSELIHIEYKDYHCSECGHTVENIKWNVDGELVDRYCSVCGAKMEKYEYER